MMNYFLEMFGISLALTLLLELLIGLCFGYRSGRMLLLVLLVNVLTNPGAVLLHWLGIPQIPIEIVVVFLETIIYLWFAKDEKWVVPRPVLFPMVANCVSWGMGLLIQWIGG